MRSTSKGSATIYSPFKENMTTMVKSKAISVIGLILGMNFSWYHCFPLALISVKRVMTPAIKGMPR